VNVVDRRIEVYTEPGNGTYARVRQYERGERLRIGRFADIEFAVTDVMR
jgi:hypothetical protein